MTKVKKKNPADLTGRNLKADKKRDGALDEKLNALVLVCEGLAARLAAIELKLAPREN